MSVARDLAFLATNHKEEVQNAARQPFSDGPAHTSVNLVVNLAEIQDEGQWYTHTPIKKCSDEVDLLVLRAECEVCAEGAIESDSTPKRLNGYKEPVPGSAHEKGASKFYRVVLCDITEYLGE